MPAKLTIEQLSEIAAHPGEPVPVLNEATQETYYLIGEGQLTYLESVAANQGEASLARIRRLITEGDESPEVDALVVHAEIRARAAEIDARSA